MMQKSYRNIRKGLILKNRFRLFSNDDKKFSPFSVGLDGKEKSKPSSLDNLTSFFKKSSSKSDKTKEKSNYEEKLKKEN